MLQVSPSSYPFAVSWAGFTPPGSPWPADERMHCLLAQFLASSPQHCSLKLYHSGVTALHVEQGFVDPLQNCLCLECIYRGIKRSQDSSSSTHLPISHDLILVIWKSINLPLPDHCMFWAACTLGYFGFL